LPKIKRSAVAPLDLFGMIFGPLAFAALAYGISEGATSWSSTKTILGLVIGVTALILFVVTELTRKRQPLLELRVFRSGNFTRGILVQWVAQIALFGTIFLVPQFLQGPKGFSAFHAGLTVLPQALSAGVFMAIGGRLFDKFGARPIVFTGMVFVACAGFILSRVAGASGGSLTMIFPLALLGAGMGLSMMPLNTHLIQAAPQNLVSRVTSLTGAFQMIMNSFGVAGLVTILTRHIKDNIAAGSHPMHAMTSAFSSTFLVVAFVGIIGAILSTMMKKPKLVIHSDRDEPAAESMMMGH
jgi:MFS family permease